MDPVRRPVTVSIGELHLDGLPPFQRFTVAAALEAELQRLMTERGLPPQLLAGAEPVVSAIDPTGLGPAEIGRSVAAAIYEGWR